MSQYGHFTMSLGCYSQRGKMTGKCLFPPLKGSKSHAKYYFLTRCGPIHLPIKYRNFAQSPFNSFLSYKFLSYLIHYTFFILIYTPQSFKGSCKLKKKSEKNFCQPPFRYWGIWGDFFLHIFFG